jgi:hypothetical protein
LHTSDVVDRDNFGADNQLARWIEHQTIDISIRRLRHKTEGEQQKTSNYERDLREAHTDSPASNEFSTAPLVVRRTSRRFIS